MKFRIVNNYKSSKSGVYAEEVNQKLQYFHHYWSYLLDISNRKWLSMNDERFESHRSLFTKINLQLSENPKKYPRRISALFISHPYFQYNVLLRKNKRIVSKIDAMKTYFKSNLEKNGKVITEDEKSKHVLTIRSGLNQIEKFVIGKGNTVYISKVLTTLITTLQDKSNISPQWKTDIKFLINAVIIELYHFGYSLSYIEKLPEILLFPKANSNEFPFDKIFSDFQYDEDKFDAYKKEELKNLTLKKQISSFANLIKWPINKGYLIFKIDNFDFQDEALKILDVTFYNPQIESKLNTDGLDDEHTKYVSEIEWYFEQGVDDLKKEKYISSCNAIIEVQHRPLVWGKADKSIYNALQKVNNAYKS